MLALTAARLQVTGVIDMKTKPMIGQRVIISGSDCRKEIGLVIPAFDKILDKEGYAWVDSPSRGYACCFDIANIEPLPGGQL